MRYLTEAKKIYEEVEKILEELNSTYQELAELNASQIKLKSYAESEFYRLYALEKYRATSAKRTVQDMKDSVKIKLFSDEKYRRYIDYEERKDVLKRKIRILQANVDSLKLKFDILKYM